MVRRLDRPAREAKVHSTGGIIPRMYWYFSRLAEEFEPDKESFGRIGADSRRSYFEPRRRQPPSRPALPRTTAAMDFNLKFGRIFIAYDAGGFIAGCRGLAQVVWTPMFGWKADGPKALAAE